MKDINDLQPTAMDILAATSRTFFIPISNLVPGLQEAVTSAYLSMRAIDEIEDHPTLSSEVKVDLLNTISQILSTTANSVELNVIFSSYQTVLPSVTIRLNEWIELSPLSIAPRIKEATATMASQMAGWVEKGWKIKTEEDLDDYTFCVAGAVGVLLSDIWMWYDNIKTDYNKAAAFGRGLQSVNILRNRVEDGTRGVDFFPSNWGMEEMILYTRRNLALADAYTEELPAGPILDFCRIPLALAHGTLEALVSGESKLDRAKVIQIVQRILGK